MIFMGDDLGLCSRPHDLITDLMTASRYFKTALQHPKTAIQRMTLHAPDTSDHIDVL